MPILDEQEALLLAGARGFKLARTPAEVERELASGFRPSAVVLDVGSNTGRGRALAEKVASHPACKDVPILKLSGDQQRLRLTLVNDPGASLSDPARLEELLAVLEELCFDLQGARFPRAGATDGRQVAGRTAGRSAEAVPAFPEAALQPS